MSTYIEQMNSIFCIHSKRKVDGVSLFHLSNREYTFTAWLNCTEINQLTSHTAVLLALPPKKSSHLPPTKNQPLSDVNPKKNNPQIIIQNTSHAGVFADLPSLPLLFAMASDVSTPPEEVESMPWQLTVRSWRLRQSLWRPSLETPYPGYNVLPPQLATNKEN